MINKIQKIKKYGIFSDFTWNNGLAQFRRYNLIYGWNGSGKTTLSKLFSAISGESDDEFPDSTFSLTIDGIEYKKGDKGNSNIRVFNQNYVDRNITKSTTRLRPIFIVGEEKKELVEQVASDEKMLNGDSSSPENLGLIAKLLQKQSDLRRYESELDKEFTNVARLIGTATTGVLSRNYRRPEAQKKFSELSEKSLITEEELKAQQATLKQSEMSHELPELDLSDVFSRVSDLTKQASEILQKTVSSVVIDELRDKKDLSEWVGEGLDLHKKYGASECIFCAQTVSEERFEELYNHFNDADRNLKADVDNLLHELRELYLAIEKTQPFDSANLYEELRESYDQGCRVFTHEKNKLLESIATFGDALNNKKMHTTESISMDVAVDPSRLKNAAVDLNSIRASHCDKARAFNEAKNTAAKKLEQHFLSTIYDKIMELRSKISSLKTEIERLQKGGDGQLGIEDLQNRIIRNKNVISSMGPAAERLTSELCTFLGRSELEFLVDGDGYSIRRNGKHVNNLSEGEKSAIAFVFFTIHLDDRDFDRENGIIVIDDPISSLDSNSLFQAFSFLKNSVKDARQTIVLTHNFDFLRLLLSWMKHRSVRAQSKFYMISNHYKEGERAAELVKLDPALENFESEYQYLCKRLIDFVDSGTIDSVYDMPNICRKVLETFLMYMVPNNQSVFNKLEEVEFDENKKTALYKFTNDQSHMTGKGLDPSLVPESQKCIKYLLEMIESVLPSHYQALLDS